MTAPKQSSSASDELRSCPFCGGEPQFVCGGPGNWYVRCMACGAASDDLMRHVAIERWNARSPQAQAGETETSPRDTSSLPSGESDPSVTTDSPGAGTVAQGWQDISTAPKDETRILLYQKGRGSFEGWWKLDWPLGEYWMDDADSEPEPTHWQPLLPAPSVPSTPPKTAAPFDVGSYIDDNGDDGR